MRISVGLRLQYLYTPVNFTVHCMSVVELPPIHEGRIALVSDPNGHLSGLLGSGDFFVVALYPRYSPCTI